MTAAGRLFLAACAALLLQSCASLPSQEAGGRAYAGRFALTVGEAAPADNVPADPDPANAPPARQAWSGRFSLQVDGGQLRLDLVSPMGATLARFETEPGAARLLVPEHGAVRVEQDHDADALAQRVLGWSLPLSGMADWLEGRPSPARPFTAQPAAPGAQSFEQDGWSVTVEEASPERPGRLLQARRGALAGSPAVSLRVILDAPGAG